MPCLFSRVRVDTPCVVDFGDILAGGVEPWLGGANDAPADVRLDHPPELSLAQDFFVLQKSVVISFFIPSVVRNVDIASSGKTTSHYSQVVIIRIQEIRSPSSYREKVV